ncbi:uncharacterized protein LOC114937319 [Nylanderia fulva]|uniref:uncharacterized protein LOC114937319 n=1 Tax=Nylanderia fulva TaxID=613905 RepID=UPI0010FAFC8E|nr:uncharacterized protein LOC114937319 [Nylanderia fulva]
MALISFDEGPSKYTEDILKVLELKGVRAMFFLNPRNITKEIVDKILEGDHSIGLSVVEDYSEMDIDEIKRSINGNISSFIEKIGYKPKSVRLPRMGYNNETVKIAEECGLIVSRPIVDSEDVDLHDFTPYLIDHIKGTDPGSESISIVFRDRVSKTLRSIGVIIDLLSDKGYSIVSFREYSGMCDKLERMEENSEMKENEVADVENKVNGTNEVGEESDVGEEGSSGEGKMEEDEEVRTMDNSTKNWSERFKTFYTLPLVALLIIT